MQPVVECLSLTKVFQDFWGRDKVLAVDSLELEIRPGEVFGLLGPNGSGKTTTVKMLLGLLYPTSGAARVFNQPPTDTGVKSRIGFMPEESYLYRYLNAYETLDYYGRLFRLDRHERNRRTDQLIEMVGLKRAGRRPVGTYSKGMARRIGLAQALINDPDLLILDEPTTGLDPVGARQIKDVIRALGRRGKTVLLCSHLLADVEDVCDRVAILYGGRRQAVGRVDELLERRDITQITTGELNEETIDRIRQIVAQAGSDVIAVDHPTDRLEELFLRVVGQAQRERLQTSGAESTVGVSEFLVGEKAGERPVSLVESLVRAARRPQAEPESPEPAGSTEVTSPPRQDVISELTAGAAPVPAEPTDQEPGADEPSESPAASPEADRSVLDRLMENESAEQPDD